MEFHSALSPTLEPALKRDHTECPAERKACDRDADVHEHHDIVVTLAHRGDRDLLRGEHKLEPAAGEHERGDRFRGRTGRKNGPRRTEPEEEVREATHNGESGEEIPPQNVDLNLEEVRLEVCAHGCASNADA